MFNNFEFKCQRKQAPLQYFSKKFEKISERNLQFERYGNLYEDQDITLNKAKEMINRE